ncbi:MAG: 50S ribosomal protein L20 [Bacilli bacterium]|nr:50S ribosomal protein L20 [Bacilli bacterium]
MTRVKGGTIHRARRAKVLKEAKGYFGSKHRLYRTAKEQLMHSGKYAYRDRRQKKRDFRKLWITRINAACRLNEISYSKFIDGLNKAGININRKMLAEIAINDEKAFAELVKTAKQALEGKLEPVKEVKAAPKKETAKVETKKEEAKPATKTAAKKPAAKATTKTTTKTTAKKPAAKTTAKKTATKKA